MSLIRIRVDHLILAAVCAIGIWLWHDRNRPPAEPEAVVVVPTCSTCRPPPRPCNPWRRWSLWKAMMRRVSLTPPVAPTGGKAGKPAVQQVKPSGQVTEREAGGRKADATEHQQAKA